MQIHWQDSLTLRFKLSLSGVLKGNPAHLCDLMRSLFFCGVKLATTGQTQQSVIFMIKATQCLQPQYDECNRRDSYIRLHQVCSDAFQTLALAAHTLPGAPHNAADDVSSPGLAALLMSSATVSFGWRHLYTSSAAFDSFGAADWNPALWTLSGFWLLSAVQKAAIKRATLVISRHFAVDPWEGGLRWGSNQKMHRLSGKALNKVDLLTLSGAFIFLRLSKTLPHFSVSALVRPCFYYYFVCVCVCGYCSNLFP